MRSVMIGLVAVAVLLGGCSDEIREPHPLGKVIHEEQSDRLIINLTKAGEIWIDGRTYEYGSTAFVRKLEHEAQSARGDAGISERQVLIRADRATPYQSIEKILRAMTAENIRMYRIQFGAQEDNSGQKRAEPDRSESAQSEEDQLPPDIRAQIPRPPSLAKLTIWIEGSSSGPQSGRRWEFRTSSLQTKDPRVLEEHIRLFVLRDPRKPVAIAPSSETPYEAVVEVLNACVGAKASQVNFVMHPDQSKEK